jgi:hypothetical protein
VAKPGNQWRPIGARPERERGAEPVGPADGRRSGLEDLSPLTRREGYGLWLSLGGSGNRVDRRLRHGAFAVAAPSRRSANNAEAGCLQDDWRPFGTPEAGKAAAAGRRAVKRVTTWGRRCRQRLFGAVVDGFVSVLASTRERRGEERLRRSERCKPRARELETWRILVTTSRLQKLLRSISSRITGSLVLKGRLDSWWSEAHEP